MSSQRDWKRTPKVREICVIAPTQQLAEKAERIIAEYHYDNIDVFVVGIGRRVITECAKTLGKKGAKVIITRRGSQQIVMETTKIKVVGLNNSIMDYLGMLKDRGFHAPDPVALFSYDPLSQELMEVCRLLGVQVKNYIFKTFEDCQECVIKAMEDGSAFGIGGSWTALVSKEMKFDHITVENSEESLLNAFDTARQIREIQREEAVKQQALQTRMETYQAVLNFTHDAILSIDDHARISVLNPVAERIIGCQALESVGKPVEEVLPNTLMPEALKSGKRQMNQIMQINKTLTSTNRIPIVVDGQIRGVVATFQDVKQLQTTEQNIRLKLHEKGLVAKYTFSDILGTSGAIERAMKTAQSYASSLASVLIHGETGTGKEMFAQSIHNASLRCSGPFVAVNCAAMSYNLLESELFGYESGAFTGAAKNGREGLFELAHGGTIFLDEIGEISKETQVELLRVIQEKEIRRVGGSRIIPVDVRIISATNLDLAEEIAQGRFREDLYYRLNVLKLEVPPLREREEDVKLIGQRLFLRLCGEGTSTFQTQYLELLDKLKDYCWYGNIRELQNFTERVFVLLKNGVETDSVIWELLRHKPTAKQVQDQTESEERNQLLATLKQHEFLEDAAASLGISRQTLWRRMKKYGIHR